MAELYVLAKGQEPNKEYFDGEGSWTTDRIDGKEYASKEAAAEDILRYRLPGDIITEPGVPSDWFGPKLR